jgi:integrase/recombinase XerD
MPGAVRKVSPGCITRNYTPELEFGEGRKAARMNSAIVDRGAWRDRWISSKSSVRTRESYTHSIGQWFTFLDSAGVGVWLVDSQHADDFRNFLDRAGRKPRGIRRELATASSFYKYVLRHGRPAPVERNPFEWVERPPVPKTTPSIALDVAQTELLRVASIEAGPRTAAVVHLLLGTAVRVTEACGAKVQGLSDSGDGGRLLTVTRKGGVEEQVQIPAGEWEVISRYLDTRDPVPGGWLLATTGGRRMTRSTAYRIVSETARKVTTATKVGPHDLRHTTATQALDAGVAIQEVQGMLGHASADTTQKYDRNANRRGRQAATRVSDIYAQRARERES